MKLSKIISSINYYLLTGDTDITISDIVYDSRKVVKNSLFVCLVGSSSNGHLYIEDAINKGASAILVSEDITLPENVTVIKVNDTRKALAYISAEFFSNPAKELTTIAITGTKGKTTTVAMIKSIFDQGNIKCGTIGTLGIIIGDKIIKTNNTTPESYEIQKAMREMVDSGCKVMIIEASSIGLKAHRTDAIEFDYGIFTNFSNDHIGGVEHKDMKEYLECKALLFKQCKVGIFNIDDNAYEKIIKNATCEIVTYGTNSDADYFAKNDKLLASNKFLGVEFDVAGKMNAVIQVSIPGKFSVYNALCATALCNLLGIDKNVISNGLKNVNVKGRVEIVPTDEDYTLLIDYAHNALSMENVLSTLRAYNPNRLVVLFGAGGNRPKARRYEMGEVCGQMADLSIITEDNSRFEDVMDIIEDIKVGIKKTNGEYVIVPNRKDAIKYAIENAQTGDIIVLAGKGHEDYQEIKGVKYHLDEREIIAEIFNNNK